MSIHWRDPAERYSSSFSPCPSALPSILRFPLRRPKGALPWRARFGRRTPDGWGSSVRSTCRRRHGEIPAADRAWAAGPRANAERLRLTSVEKDGCFGNGEAGGAKVDGVFVLVAGVVKASERTGAGFRLIAVL